MLLPPTFRPATEVTLTTAPPPARRITGAAALVQSQIPLTFTSNVRSQTSSLEGIDIAHRHKLGVTGVVHQHIDVAKLTLGLLDERCDLGGGRDVSLDRQ